MDKKHIAYKMTLSGVLIAIAVILGTFSVPVFGGRMSPIQHFVNVVSAVCLGPYYALLNGFLSALIRNLLGTGSFLAFPGSMIGGFLAGLLYKKFKKLELALVGEIIGTGIIGALIAYPIAKLALGQDVAVFTYVIPFLISCTGGAVMAYIFLKVPAIRKILIKEGES